MNIAILSFTTSKNNYGQFLQCYALQQFLRLRGHSAKHIRYIPPSARSSVRNIGDVAKLVQRYLSRDYIYDKLRSKLHPLPGDEIRLFDHFLGRYIEVFPDIYRSPLQLISDPPEVDALIVGSDQVWGRPLGTDDSKIWFLKFGNPNVRKISYAASIGRNLEEFEVAQFQEEVTGFNRISVREKKAQDICKRCGIDTEVVLDPTLLLNASEYPLAGVNGWEDSSIAPNKPYIFCYILNVLTEKDLGWNPIGEYARSNDLEVVPVYSSGYYSAYPIISGYEPQFPTIPQWLDLVRRSEAVVTTSFHGMVFSILMHRPFLVIPLKGKHSGGNDRIVTLLTSLGLETRIYDSSRPVDIQMDGQIDWDSVDSKLSELRRTSEQFLSDALA